ncbi:MAG TPA: hypothetical protein ACFYD4_16460 [Candidatus Wunengus sp. YC61]|uniref:hypothetical protein n=1 Tax=Candidatus Wunengus sp. YC61 TaxID=3367698 RepID=UPI0040282523
MNKNVTSDIPAPLDSRVIQSCKPVKVEPDGWSTWQHPKMRGYKMQCCDCGLIHEVEFKIIKVIARKRWGWKEMEEVGKEYEVELRMKRAENGKI